MPWEPQTLEDALDVLHKNLPREMGFPRTMPAAWRILLTEVERLGKATAPVASGPCEELKDLREDITLLSADITALNQAVAKLQEAASVTRVTPNPKPDEQASTETGKGPVDSVSDSKPVKKTVKKKTPKKAD